MKILILNTFPVWGGGEKCTIILGKGLSDRGHHVVISSPPGSETEKRAVASGLKIFPFNIKWDIAFWRIFPFKKYLKDNAIDVVLCVQNRDVKVGALAARLAGSPAIFAWQGLDNIRQKLFHKIAFTKFVDGIITNTVSIKKLYKSYNWFKDDFIHVIYDGLIMPDNLLKKDLHKEFDLKPASKVIVGAGRLAGQKRFDLLVKVAAIAKDQHLNWRFIIAGTGKLEKDLKMMATDLGVEDMIRFIGFRDDVLNLMYSADIFVLTSDAEGLSNALKEAMAVGLPCVATNVFGVEELFQDGKSGVMVNKGDARSIFEGINTVFENDHLRDSISRNGKELVKTLFGVDTMVSNFEILFKARLERRLRK